MISYYLYLFIADDSLDYPIRLGIAYQNYINNYISYALLKLIVILLILGVFYWLFLKFQRRRYITNSKAIGVIDNKNKKVIESYILQCTKTKQEININIVDSTLSFDSVILGIKREGKKKFVVIDTLVPHEGNRLLTKGYALLLNYWPPYNNNKTGNIGHCFNTCFVKSVHFNGFPALQLEFPETIKQFQRRRYARVIVPEHFELRAIYSINNIRFYEDIIIDISEGGFTFPSNIANLSIGTRLRYILIYNYNGCQVQAKGIIRHIRREKVVSSTDTDNRDTSVYVYGLELSIDTETRDSIFFLVREIERYITRTRIYSITE